MIAIIEDNRDMFETYRFGLEDHFDHRIEHFESLSHLDQSGKHPDIVITDVSAICPISQTHHAYGPICSYIEKHPGIPIIVCSALGGTYTIPIINDVISQFDEKPLITTVTGRFLDTDELADAIRSFGIK